MKFEDWLKEHAVAERRPAEPEKKNAEGGFDPDPEQVARFKKADLITLTVPGTNCFNCEYSRNKHDGKAFCVNEEIKAWVTEHMCCAYWDRHDINRTWKK